MRSHNLQVAYFHQSLPPTSDGISRGCSGDGLDEFPKPTRIAPGDGVGLGLCSPGDGPIEALISPEDGLSDFFDMRHARRSEQFLGHNPAAGQESAM